MLKKIRIILAALFFVGLILLFAGCGGLFTPYFGWMAKMQFLPAVLALNFVVFCGISLVALIFGRFYCSIVCPLGVMQDCFSWLGGKAKKNRFQYKKGNTVLRIIFLVAFVLLMLFGLNGLALLIAPYSAWGRIATSMLAPVYGWCNNLLAAISAHFGSYAFYPTEVYLKSLPVLIVAVVTFIIIAVLAWRGGRTWCNTVCPVGTTLGLLSRFAIFRPVINTDKCVNCVRGLLRLHRELPHPCDLLSDRVRKQEL